MDETHSIPMDMFHANDYVQTLLKILEGQSTLGIDIYIDKKKILVHAFFRRKKKKRKHYLNGSHSSFLCLHPLYTILRDSI